MVEVEPVPMFRFTVTVERDYPYWRDAESIQEWVRAVRRGGLPEQGRTVWRARG